MPVEVHISGPDTVVTALPLEPAAFAPFGSVVQNPKPHLHPSAFATAAATGRGASLQLPFHPVAANQGSAIKYQHVTHMLDLYAQAPSRQPGRAVMNMFVCAARTLDRKEGSGSAGFFPVTILERHPFTTQTFVPISTDPAQRYLVIVAPSLSPSQADEMLPVPSISSETRLPGRGLPDLRRLRAFVARVDQAVTYGAGTWHAPMAALGPPGTAVDFVVVQFANGVALEDCQEVTFTERSSTAAGGGGGGGGGGGNPRGRVFVQVPLWQRQSKL